MRNILISTDYNYLQYCLNLIESILITSKLVNHKIYIHIENNIDKCEEKIILLFNKYDFSNYEIIFIETENSKKLFQYVPEKYHVIYRRLFAPEFLKKPFLYLDIDGVVFNDVDISFDFLEKKCKKPFFISTNMDKILTTFDQRDLDMFDFLKRLENFYDKKTPPEAFKIISKYKSYVFTACLYYNGEKIDNSFYEELINQYKRVGSYNIDECGSWDEMLLNICIFNNEKIEQLFQKINIHFDITLNKVYHHFGPFKEQLKNPLISCGESIDDFQFPRKGFLSQITYFEILKMFKEKTSISNLYKNKVLNKEVSPLSEEVYKEILKNKKQIIKIEGKEVYDDIISDYLLTKEFLNENYSDI